LYIDIAPVYISAEHKRGFKGGAMFGNSAKFIQIQFDNGIWRYLRLSEIESIDTSIEKSPEDSDERKAGHPYRARVRFLTRSGRDTEVVFPRDTDRQINLKRFLKLWSKRL
jgi:hypothetical protein